ncbi:MAG TPA: hypothetical protein VNN18_07110 [Candidatus Xenobia bacterium]|nr:hypothetical protein [Candidatus Xenobia bacterium]
MRNRILALGVVMLLAVSVAYAGGDSKGGKMDPAAKAAWFQKEFGLTDTQTQQVRALIEDTHARYEQVKTQGLSEEATKAEKTKIKAEHDAKLKSILTAEQWAKFEAYRAEHYKKEQASKKQ